MPLDPSAFNRRDAMDRRRGAVRDDEVVQHGGSTPRSERPSRGGWAHRDRPDLLLKFRPRQFWGLHIDVPPYDHLVVVTERINPLPSPCQNLQVLRRRSDPRNQVRRSQEKRPMSWGIHHSRDDPAWPPFVRTARRVSEPEADPDEHRRAA